MFQQDEVICRELDCTSATKKTKRMISNRATDAYILKRERIISIYLGDQFREYEEEQ